MNSIGCMHCSAKFANKNQRTAHNRAKHQEVINLVGLGGLCFRVKRTSEGVWKCPYPGCGNVLGGPSTMWKHFREKHKRSEVVNLSMPSQATPPEASNSSDPVSQEVPMTQPRGSDSAPALSPDRENADGIGLSDMEAWDGCVEDAVLGQAEELEFEDLWDGPLAFLPQSGLRRVDLVFDVILLVCIGCQKILDGSRAKHVLRHVRRESNPPRHVLKLLEKWLPEAGFASNQEVLEDFLRTSEEPHSAVPWVEVIRGGYSCPHCKYYVPGMKTMKNHIRRKHAINRRGNRCAPQKVSLQRLFLGKQDRYFRVKPMQSESDRAVKVKELEGPLTKVVEAIESQSSEHCEPQTRELAAFLRHSGFPQIAEELVPGDASFDSVKGAMLISAEEASGVYGRLAEVTLAYLEFADGWGKQIPYSFKEAVRWKKNKKKSLQGFKRHMLAESVKKYSEVLTELVLCLLRYACDDADQSELVLIVKCPQSESFASNVRRFKAQLLRLRGAPVDAKTFNMIPLHEVLVELWCPKMREGKLRMAKPWEDVVMQFIILWSLKESSNREQGRYAFKEVELLSQFFAKLKYFAHATLDLELSRKNWDEKFPERLNTIARGEALLQWSDPTPKLLNTPLSMIDGHGRLAATIIRSNPGPPSLVRLGRGLCSIDGWVLSRRSFARMVNGLVRDMDVLMNNSVLRGLNTDWADELLASGKIISDQLRNVVPGYSFVTDPSNFFLNDHRRDLWFHLFQTRALSGEYLRGRAGGKILWNLKALRVWEADCDRLMELMNLLLVLAMGLPPRCQEVGSYLMRNTATNRRTFFWVRGTLALVPQYNKTNTPSNPSKEISKHLPEELRAHFLVLFAVIRPTMAYVTKLLNGQKAQAIYEDKWYVCRGQRGDCKKMTLTLMKAFTEYLKAPTINSQKYRHFAQWASEEITATMKTLRLYDEAVDKQAGHSSQTAEMMYTRDLEGLNEMSQRQWEAGYMVSKRWGNEVLDLPPAAVCRSFHRDGPVCGEVYELDRPRSGEPSLLPSSPCSGEPSQPRQPGQSSQPRHPSQPSQPAEDGSGAPPKVGRDGSSTSLSRSSFLGSTRESTWAVPGLGSAAKRARVQYEEYPSIAGGPRPELEVQEGKFAHRALVALSGLGYTAWKTSEQARAVSLAVENVNSFLAVLPTGSGKSVIFMAAALSRKEGVVVVVVPLRTLVWNQKRACDAAKVNCWEYHPGHEHRVPDPFCGVVFVSVEQAGSEDFLGWARHSLAIQRLHCIVFDEVHLVLCDFRCKMKDLYRLGFLKCQLIGLTASLRPEEEGPVMSALGRKLAVMRSSTVRPNLVYAATVVSDETRMDEVIMERLSPWWMEAAVGNEGAEGVGKEGAKYVGEDRAMVYCLTVAEAKATADTLPVLAARRGQRLDVAVLHAKLKPEEYQEALRSWEDGRKPVLVATGVIGCGYDYPHVRMVLHRGLFFSLADYHQQSGRCGRDGRQGHCEVVYSCEYLSRKTGQLTQGDKPFLVGRDAEAVMAADEWMRNSTVCRRWGLHKEMDGVSQRCSLVPGGLLCDVCSGESKVTAGPPWEPTLAPHYQDLEEVDVENGEWGLPAQPSVTMQDAAYYRDLERYQKLRRYANWFMETSGRVGPAALCSLCSIPEVSERAKSHSSRGACPNSQFRCLRCFSDQHYVGGGGCPNNFMKRKAKGYNNTCHLCYFPMSSAFGVQLHAGKAGGGKECDEGLVGDAILSLIWYCFRNEQLSRTLKAEFGVVGLPELDTELEPWLMRRVGCFNHFIRVGSACTQAYSRFLQLNQRPASSGFRGT